jgi:hypothetical protein
VAWTTGRGRCEKPLDPNLSPGPVRLTFHPRYDYYGNPIEQAGGYYGEGGPQSQYGDGTEQYTGQYGGEDGTAAAAGYSYSQTGYGAAPSDSYTSGYGAEASPSTAPMGADNGGAGSYYGSASFPSAGPQFRAGYPAASGGDQAGRVAAAAAVGAGQLPSAAGSVKIIEPVDDWE